MDLEESARLLDEFTRGSLRQRLGDLERCLAGAGRDAAIAHCESERVGEELIQAALLFKSVAGEINVIIHAVGILLSLPSILEPDERLEYLSLGAGNTGKRFDMATNRRVAEFKFTHWRGGPETIRQNQLFKDFFGLAAANEPRRKCLYLLGLERPLRFFNGRRALASVLSKNAAVAAHFRALHGTKYSVVREYYLDFKHTVDLVDLLAIVPSLALLPDEDAIQAQPDVEAVDAPAVQTS